MPLPRRRLLRMGDMSERPLDPLLPAEEGELDDRGRDDQAPRPRIAPLPAELRKMVAEVLAVQADDERWEEQHGGDHRQRLHYLVLVVPDLRLQVVAHA